MIKYLNDIFKIDTKNTSYIVRISKFNHVFNDYYGSKIIDEDNFEFSKEKYATTGGTTVTYLEEDCNYILDNYSLEVSSPGEGKSFKGVKHSLIW